jgi:hypothetical protein
VVPAILRTLGISSDPPRAQSLVPFGRIGDIFGDIYSYNPDIVAVDIRRDLNVETNPPESPHKRKLGKYLSGG